MARPLAWLLVVFWTTAPLRAGISSPDSYLIPSADGRTLFVMLSRDRLYDARPAATLPDGRVVNLADTFGGSGLYDAVTLRPRWRVNWFSLQGDLYHSPDFRHVLRVNRGGLDRGWVLRFYGNGVLVREYDAASVLTGLRSILFLPYSTWDWHVRWYDDYDLDPLTGRFFLTTPRRRFLFYGHRLDLGLQESYTFDLSTGAILSQKVSGAWVLWAYGVLIPVAFALAMIATRALWRRFRRRARGRGFPVELATGASDAG
jgi:hypothetical protein